MGEDNADQVQVEGAAGKPQPFAATEEALSEQVLTSAAPIEVVQTP